MNQIQRGKEGTNLSGNRGIPGFTGPKSSDHGCALVSRRSMTSLTPQIPMAEMRTKKKKTAARCWDHIARVHAEPPPPWPHKPPPSLGPSHTPYLCFIYALWFSMVYVSYGKARNEPALVGGKVEQDEIRE